MPEGMNTFCNNRSEGLGLCLRMLGGGLHGRAVSKSGEARVFSGCSTLWGTDRRKDPGDDGLGLGPGLGDGEEETGQSRSREVMFEILHSEEEHSRLPRGGSCSRQEE